MAPVAAARARHTLLADGREGGEGTACRAYV
ncbi:protein of unknown function [Candidatus Hydrogenisulfobacillus filiaventi]|uniref:Uncharacterized protein n=1 Tax=Candidatus Hydrogenisulfobacillus filiaventi TaxID=2707344 RepID=A0A6F8ZEZ8_9FIRM|nr:protein of unknown function [Candidatus Hydrogenisulfobacillus filiaventi]